MFQPNSGAYWDAQYPPPSLYNSDPSIPLPSPSPSLFNSDSAIPFPSNPADHPYLPYYPHPQPPINNNNNNNNNYPPTPIPYPYHQPLPFYNHDPSQQNHNHDSYSFPLNPHIQSPDQQPGYFPANQYDLHRPTSSPQLSFPTDQLEFPGSIQVPMFLQDPSSQLIPSSQPICQANSLNYQIPGNAHPPQQQGEFTIPQPYSHQSSPLDQPSPSLSLPQNILPLQQTTTQTLQQPPTPLSLNPAPLSQENTNYGQSSPSNALLQPQSASPSSNNHFSQDTFPQTHTNSQTAPQSLSLSQNQTLPLSTTEQQIYASLSFPKLSAPLQDSFAKCFEAAAMAQSKIREIENFAEFKFTFNGNSNWCTEIHADVVAEYEKLGENPEDLPAKVKENQESILTWLSYTEEKCFYPNFLSAFSEFCRIKANGEQLLAVINEFEIRHADQEDNLPSHFQVFANKLSWVVNTHSSSTIAARSSLYPLPGTVPYWIEVFAVVTELMTPPTSLVKWDAFLRDL